MREDNTVSTAVKRERDIEEKKDILYAEVEETVEAWEDILELFDRKGGRKEEYDSKSVLAFEELREDLWRKEEDWGTATTKKAWENLRAWQKIPLLYRLNKVKDKSKDRLPRTYKRAQMMENYINMAVRSITGEKRGIALFRKCLSTLKSLLRLSPLYK